MLFVWILLLASVQPGDIHSAPPSRRVELSDEICQIPAGQWRYRDVELHGDPARMSASYEVLFGSGRVRLAFIDHVDLDRMREDLPHGWIAETPTGLRGQLADRFHRRGDYALVVDNRDGHSEAKIHLHIWLDFGPGRGPEVSELPHARQLTVVALSLMVFAGIVTFSGRRLWRAVKK
jgi:hypothetical protein